MRVQSLCPLALCQHKEDSSHCFTLCEGFSHCEIPSHSVTYNSLIPYAFGARALWRLAAEVGHALPFVCLCGFSKLFFSFPIPPANSLAVSQQTFRFKGEGRPRQKASAPISLLGAGRESISSPAGVLSAKSFTVTLCRCKTCVPGCVEQGLSLQERMCFC